MSNSRPPKPSAGSTPSPGRVQPRLGAGRPGRHAGAPRLGAADQHDVDVAGGDVEAGPVDEGLGHVAAALRVDALAEVGDAEAVGDEATGVGVAPRQDLTRGGSSRRRRAACRGRRCRCRRRPGGRPRRRGRRVRRRSRPGRPGCSTGHRRPAQGCGDRGSRWASKRPLDRPVNSVTLRHTWESRLATVRRIDGPRILVLCTANQCRSPMAEGILADLIARRGVEAVVDSAGLLPGGAPAAPHTLDVLAERGIDFSAHRSRSIYDPGVRPRRRRPRRRRWSASTCGRRWSPSRRCGTGPSPSSTLVRRSELTPPRRRGESVRGVGRAPGRGAHHDPLPRLRRRRGRRPHRAVEGPLRRHGEAARLLPRPAGRARLPGEQRRTTRPVTPARP